MPTREIGGKIYKIILSPDFEKNENPYDAIKKAEEEFNSMTDEEFMRKGMPIDEFYKDEN